MPTRFMYVKNSGITVAERGLSSVTTLSRWGFWYANYQIAEDPSVIRTELTMTVTINGSLLPAFGTDSEILNIWQPGGESDPQLRYSNYEVWIVYARSLPNSTEYLGLVSPISNNTVVYSRSGSSATLTLNGKTVPVQTTPSLAYENTNIACHQCILSVDFKWG
jgi:hypothetical protein